MGFWVNSGFRKLWLPVILRTQPAVLCKLPVIDPGDFCTTWTLKWICSFPVYWKACLRLGEGMTPGTSARLVHKAAEGTSVKLPTS